MAIQALSPYYGTSADVREAVHRALEWVNSQEIIDAEGYAQLIVALSALGRDAESYVDALLAYHDPVTGAFMRSGRANMMTTEQAVNALIAYHRFRTGQRSLYDMRDATWPEVPQ